MKHINNYANISEYNADTNRDPYNSVSYIKDENRVEYNFMIGFADLEAGRVLHANGLIASPTHSTPKELATIRSLNPSGEGDGSYFFNNQVITQFPELKYFTGLTSLYYTFNGCSSLTTAPVIPEGVTDLTGTFFGCSNLTTAPTIPEGVTNLPFTFSGCSSLTTAPDIPEGVTDLPETFYGCTNLTTAPTIPEGVTDLSYTFSYCSSLTTAPVIPEGVTDLPETFYGCSSIDGIYIINIVTPISYSDSLSNVQAIYVPDASVSAYKSASGWIRFADNIYPFSEGPFEVSGIFADPEVGRVLHANGLIASPTHSTREELATITSLNPSNTPPGSYFHDNKVITQFPELQYCTGLTNLSFTFYDCSNLTTASDIPEGVTNLSGTFGNCSSLTTAPAIPERVTNMEGTFRYCSNLTTAPDIPSSVTNLSFTFSECSSLTTAPVIPEGVTNLFGTFGNCSSIDGIYIINIVTPISYYDSLSNVQAIYVPDASVDAYKVATGWIEFEDKIFPMSTKP